MSREKPGHLIERVAIFNEAGLFMATMSIEYSLGTSVMWMRLADLDEERVQR